MFGTLVGLNDSKKMKNAKNTKNDKEKKNERLNIKKKNITLIFAAQVLISTDANQRSSSSYKTHKRFIWTQESLEINV